MIARLVPYFRTILSTAGIFLALGLSRHVDAFVRVFLRQETGQGFLSAMIRNLRFWEAAREVLTVVGFGLSIWLAVSLLLFWLSDYPLDELLGRVGRSMVPLLLPACLTIFACLSLALSPQFPYGVNLVLTLAYEGSFAPLLAWGLCAISLILTVHHMIDFAFVFDSLAPERWSWYRLGEAAIPIVALATFALATPSWLWTDGEGQGNMFKYLRMAAAFSASGELDIAKAEGAAEQASFTHLLSILPRTARGWMDESFELAGAFADSAGRGRVYVGDVVATRANRSMFRSPNGGIYYINGPLARASLFDRSGVESMVGMESPGGGHLVLESTWSVTGLGDVSLRPRGGVRLGRGGRHGLRLGALPTPPSVHLPGISGATGRAVPALRLSETSHRARAERMGFVGGGIRSRRAAMAASEVRGDRGADGHAGRVARGRNRAESIRSSDTALSIRFTASRLRAVPDGL
jgi:hypothetical protein